MDNDQEVVREPFEDGESIRSLDYSPDLVKSHTTTVKSPYYNNVVSELSSGHGNSNQIDPVDKLYLDDDNIADNDELNRLTGTRSPANVEDVQFAKKYGIALKGSESASTYERLLKSNHVLDRPRSSNHSEAQIETSVTSDCIYHKGTFYQKGDIVAMCDQDDGQIYFAQLTGFLQDQYCEKSASVLWLVPTQATSRNFFDPSAYQIGLEDTQLRKLDCMTFVRHCPHDYYLRKLFKTNNKSLYSNQEKSNQPITYGSSRSRNEQSYIWTTLRPCRVPSVESRLINNDTVQENSIARMAK